MEKTQKLTPQNGRNPTFKYYLQLETKEDVGGLKLLEEQRKFT